jgi:hypothetical protein
VLVSKFEAPPYSAVIEWLPVVSVDVPKVATPLPFRSAVPSVVAPSLNVTVPVGVPAVDVTVAVNVTDCPNVDGFSAEVSAVAVAALLTTCETALDVLILKFESPPYSAVMECVPAVRADVLSAATPLPFRTPVPSVAAPSLNVTVPVGVPPVDVTVAVNVTDCPNVDAFGADVSVVVVVPLLTVCVSVVDVLLVKLPSPSYAAVMACDPAASVELENVAWPPALSVPVPNVVVPSLNVTVPVGVPLPGAVAATVAVNVTACPKTDGFTDEVTDVLVAALFTVWVSVVDVLALKLASPPYVAVMECDATVSVEIENVAWPEALTAPVPNVVAPSLKVTVPVGVPLPGLFTLRVAVNVTDCPKTVGFTDELTFVVVSALLTVNV